MMPMIRRIALAGVLVVSLAPAYAAYDANEVPLGASEKALLQRFPAAHCTPLQWKSEAADRRCDDAKVLIGGVAGRITFYLKRDRLEAFDVRFESKDAERLAAFLKNRYGAPADETRAKLEAPRSGQLYKVAWKKGDERALLTSQTEKRRASLTVWRGDFEEEIYRIR
jgi:hypothetical protein